MKKLDSALKAIDDYNSQDLTLFSVNGEKVPQEYFFSVKVYEWVQKLTPGASEELLLAARAHHIGRWEIPREEYPEGRTGYLNWRKRLGELHAARADEILERLGYTDSERNRVKELIQKKRLKTDREAQTLENALCLVFLQYQYEDFRQKHSFEKMVRILKKSWLKMDEQGREEALKLSYSDDGLALIQQALNSVKQ